MTPELLERDCLHLCELAANSAKNYFGKNLLIDIKNDLSPVTIADKATEELVCKTILAKYPDHGILGEETGTTNPDSEYLWVIDPIDGTKSFITGFPLFGFLIAVLHEGKAVASAISMPMISEIYSATINARAKLNDKVVQTSGTTALEEAKIYINEADKILAEIPELMPRLLGCGAVRRFSYDCYPHALLAAGHLDVVVDYGLQPYDFMPLKLVVEQAGGAISDWQGNSLNMDYSGPVVSSANHVLHSQILDVLKDHGGNS